MLNVRVPNELDDSGTTKVTVQFPPGFHFLSYEPVAGWKVKVKNKKLDTPIEDHGEEITEEVSQVTFTGDGKEGIVKPGQFQDFPLSTQIPDTPGKDLTFKAIQTYDNGDVVRWIGAEDAEKPAPVVAVTEGEGEHGAAAKPAPAAQVTVDDSDDGNGLSIIALIVGGLGLLIGVLALMSGRRRKEGTA